MDEIIETTLSDTGRLFLSTPINEYTVTEGLLLVIAILMVLGWVWSLAKELF